MLWTKSYVRNALLIICVISTKISHSIYCSVHPPPNHASLPQMLCRNLRHIIMPRLLSMRARLRLPIHHDPANLTLDSHAPSIGIIMLRVQLPAQGLGFLEYLIIVRVPNPGVEFGGVGGDCVRVVGGGAGDRIVVDAAVHQDAAGQGAFVEFVYSA